MSLKKFTKEQLKEMSMMEIAFELLLEKKQVIPFNELISEISDLAKLSKEQVKSRMAQFYTDLNIDGRFITLGENKWGLRVWYPVDTVEEEQVVAVKPKKKKAKKVVDEDLDAYEDLEEELEYDDLDEFEEDDLLDDDDAFDDDEEDAVEDEAEFPIDGDVIDEDLEEDLDEDLDEEENIESLEALEEEELEADDDEDENL